MLAYLKKVINGASQESCKRFIGVVCIILFGFLFFMLIVLLPFIIFKVIPASQTTINLYYNALDKVIYYAFMIISFVIGAVAIVNSVDKISEVFANKGIADIISAQKGTPDTQVVNQNVQQQNVGKDAGNNQQQPNQEIKGG